MLHPFDEPPVVNAVRSDHAVMPRFHRVLTKYELPWWLLSDTPVLTERKDTVTWALRRAFSEVTSKAAARTTTRTYSTSGTDLTHRLLTSHIRTPSLPHPSLRP